MHFRKFLTLIGMCLILVLAIGACGGDAAEPEAADTTQEDGGDTEEMAEETTLERVRREGVIRVGFANENPYAFAQPDGTLSGEAVEVAREVFSRMGIEEMEGVLTEFGSLIPGLQAGRFDAITAGMYVNPTRCEQVLFADPEYTIGDALIVAAGNPLDLHSYEDIAANPDVTVGTGAGYLENDYMMAVGVSEDQIVNFPDDPSGFAGLQAGQIDAWTGTRPTLLRTLADAGTDEFELADPFEQPVIDGAPAVNYGAAAFRYEDESLRQEFNTHLEAVKEEGMLIELIGQFEGFDEGALPGDTKAEDICPDAYADIE
ncbi:MAG: ectoine/hydroxyectoine ABC transporter substrate-binding protein EhuB [Anaerolineaceae bacterium]|nr:ectoine/hydroxyectoine ABC transporter substrate-binding protein EhuB [Anaerolineaceae bacterium]